MYASVAYNPELVISCHLRPFASRRSAIRGQAKDFRHKHFNLCEKWQHKKGRLTAAGPANASKSPTIKDAQPELR